MSVVETLAKFDVELEMEIEEEVDKVHEQIQITPTNQWIQKIEVNWEERKVEMQAICDALGRDMGLTSWSEQPFFAIFQSWQTMLAIKKRHKCALGTSETCLFTLIYFFFFYVIFYEVIF